MKIEAAGLRVRYPGSAHKALDDVSVVCGTGLLRTIVGPNGCGKTTLLRTLLGLLRAEQGCALLAGRAVDSWDGRERARAVGVVAQSEQLPFPLRTREMVAMGRYPHLGPLAAAGMADQAIIDTALADCDLSELGDRDVGTLSGGELQRARIARALAQEPQALVLDEPTASLDLSHRMEIFNLMRRETGRGRTVVAVTHDLELAARFSDQILLLDSGRVVADGPPAKVMDAEMLSSVYGWPVAVSTDAWGALRVTPLDPSANTSARKVR